MKMKNKKFILTRKNQKGQVAIFVALIFQVVFVFFAVLINVGLLVHHKINLQQSTDLAAYYGAMKQAEIMNAISHVNFQMRQAWKLLTWRYRVLGTFGFQNSDMLPPKHVEFPLDISTTLGVVTKFNPAAQTAAGKCADTGVNTLDVPFFCAGHAGFFGWPNANENNCKINCEQMKSIPNNLDPIPTTGGFEGDFSGGVIKSVNLALDAANIDMSKQCQALGPKSFSLLSKYILAYGAEVEQKKKLIQMLGADLSKNDEAIDLDGGKITDGSKKTFEHNLTEANLASNPTFQTMNGLNTGGSKCAFQGDKTDGDGTRAQFLAQVKFQAIQFFVHQCDGDPKTSKAFRPLSIFDESDPTLQKLQDKLIQFLPPPMQLKITQAIVSVEYIIGYEKNPWCQVYYGAKSQAEPKIPFLPLAKIKLSAISFAKPFGGSIGPRYFSSWNSGLNTSDSGDKVEPALPVRKVSELPAAGTPLIRNQAILMNYSNYVGDKLGLRDALTTATYQDILLYRPLTIQQNLLKLSSGKPADEAPDNKNLIAAKVWPSYDHWKNLADPDVNTYDYLSTEPNGDNSFMRDLEIAVMAPNQFDLNYYSIEPDFFFNYYRKITGGPVGAKNYVSSFAAIKGAAGYGPGTVDEVKPDYGNNESLQKKNVVSENFSVRHQVAVAATIIKPAKHKSAGFSFKIGDDLKFTADKISSLLTGWTFETFTDYTKFPNQGPNAEFSMTFGKCADPNWNLTTAAIDDVERNYDNPVSKSLPPTPGNCVTGGRTGYSVKLISPSLVRVGAQPEPFGGAGTSGVISNAADESFFTF